jgi:hypothetical protein
MTLDLSFEFHVEKGLCWGDTDQNEIRPKRNVRVTWHTAYTVGVLM